MSFQCPSFFNNVLAGFVRPFNRKAITEARGLVNRLLWRVLRDCRNDYQWSGWRESNPRLRLHHDAHRQVRRVYCRCSSQLCFPSSL